MPSNPSQHRPFSRRGLTLIEIMIALTMTLIVLGAMMQAFQYASGQMQMGRATMETGESAAIGRRVTEKRPEQSDRGAAPVHRDDQSKRVLGNCRRSDAGQDQRRGHSTVTSAMSTMSSR